MERISTLTDEQRARIESLSDEDIMVELARSSTSRLHREKYIYLQVIWERRQQAKNDAAEIVKLKVARENMAATNSGTRWATVGWIVTSAVAVVSIVTATSMLPK